MRSVRWMVRLLVAVAVVALAGCGAPAAEVGGSGGGSGGSSGKAGGAGNPDCVVSSDGETICPDPAQRSTGWDTYAIRDDGRTVDVKFQAPGDACATIDDASGDVLPTEIHVSVSLLRTKRGCDLVDRTATVTLTEPVAGRPVYSAVSTAGGAGMSSRGYAGTVDGPQCLGPRPAPRAQIDHCPQPTNQPPPPLETTANPRLRGARAVPWTAASLKDDKRQVVLQWISTDCARLAEVEVMEPDRQPAVVLTLREVPCKGDVVVRATAVDLGRPLGNRRVIDGTAFVP